MMYNLQFSSTWAAQHSIKNLGYAVIFTIFSYIFAAELQEIDTVKYFTEVRNWTNFLLQTLSRVKRSIESEFSSVQEDTFLDSVIIPACKQLFETKGIVKDFITSILVMISKIIFWVICNTILPPLPNPGRYFHIPWMNILKFMLNELIFKGDLRLVIGSNIWT